MKIINNTNLNFKRNVSFSNCLTVRQNQDMKSYMNSTNPALKKILEQDTSKTRALGKISSSVLSYDIPEFLSAAIGITGVTYLPYILIKKVPQKENWSKFNTNLLKAGIPICAFLLADSLSYIFKGKRIFELFKKEKETK